jgi:prolipoprotein diacylglyceryltransferase
MISQGQMLSLPMFLIGIVMMYHSYKKHNNA